MRSRRKPLPALFAEELGAVLQVRRSDAGALVHAARDAGLAAAIIGTPTAGDRIRVVRHGALLIDETRIDLHRAWSSTTHALQVLRDNPESAEQEYARILDASDPGISPRLTFDPDDDIAAPYIATGARPRVAILREQGVNGQVEMAAAFDSRRLRRLRRAHERPRGRPALARRIQGLRGRRRVFLRRRARRGRGLGQVDPLQREVARRLCRVLRAARHFRARRVQRLPDDGQPARA